MTVSYRREGSVAIITIDRPERRNAIDLAAAESLRSCWERFDSDESAQVGILYGEGGHFSAGGDLKAFDLIDHPAPDPDAPRTITDDSNDAGPAVPDAGDRRYPRRLRTARHRVRYTLLLALRRPSRAFARITGKVVGSDHRSGDPA